MSSQTAPRAGERAGGDLIESEPVHCLGSYLKAGTRFRVTPQLVDIVTGEILWSDKINVDHSDIITLQDEIASKIV
ncbi:MAG: hypothetical protein HY314_08280 [Acidobacteria bacterium]|nr:hypothetical protein [Acidobacteriota bacterium]